MGGPRVTENAKKLIIGIWTNLSKSGREPTAKQVLSVSEAYIKKENRKDIFLPKIRKVQLIITEAKKYRGEIPASEKAMQEPWALSTIGKYPLSPDSLPSVLQAWRYSVSLGEVFSIRHAKWCSHLYALFKNDDISKLWFATRMYVHNEEICQLYIHNDQYPPDFEIDSSIVMSHWERETFHSTMFLLGLSEGGVSLTFSFPRANDGEIAEEFIHALPQIQYLSPDQPKEVFERLNKIDSLVRQLKSSFLFFPDLESRMVYLRHLSYLSQMPKWNSLGPEEIRDIIVDLRNWIIDQNPKRDTINVNDSLPREIYHRAGWKV